MLRSVAVLRCLGPGRLPTLLRRSAAPLTTGPSLPRYLVADDAPFRHEVDEAQVEELISEWQRLTLEQEFRASGFKLKALRDLCIIPLPYYTLTVDAATLDMAQVESVFKEQPTLKRTARLLELGVRLELPPWRQRGALPSHATPHCALPLCALP